MNPAAPVTTSPHAWPGSAATGSGSSSANGTSSPSASSTRQRSEKNRVITTPARNVAEPRLRPLAAGERERELRVAAPRRERQRERAAEARVDVGHGQRAVRLAEALDVGRADDADRLGDAGAVLDQLAVLERAALDRLAALRLDHRARDRVEAAAVDVAEDVDRELLAEAALLHHRVDRRVSVGGSRAARGRRRGRCAASRTPPAP